MTRLLQFIGYQPDPENRPWLWFVGRTHLAVGYPTIWTRPHFHVSRMRKAPRRLRVVKVLAGRVHVFWDRDRAAVWGGE